MKKRHSYILPRRLWRKLTNPVGVIKASDRRRARLLAALLVSLFLPVILLAFVLIPIHRGDAFSPLNDAEFLVVTGMLFFQVVAYWLSRTKYFQAGAILAVGVPGVAALLTLLQKDPQFGLTSTPFLLLSAAFLLSSLVQSTKSTLALAFLSSASLLVIVDFTGNLRAIDVMQPFGLVAIIAILSIIAAKIHKKDLEEIVSHMNRHAESRANFSAVIENTRDSIWSIDHDYTLLTLNSVFQTQFAMEYGKVLRAGMNIVKSSPKGIRKEWIGYYDRALSGEQFSIEKSFDFKGSSILAEISFNPIVAKDVETITGVSVFARNITAQKFAEKAIRESEERYRKLVELSPEAVIVLQSRTIGYTNTSGLELFGGKRFREVVGKSILDFVPPQYHDIVKQRIEKIQNGESKKIIEEKILRLDGAPVDVDITTAPITLEGKPASLILIRDISEQKKALQALRDAKEAAEVASQAKSRFLANMSHEIRTPLHVILGMSDLVLEEPLSTPQKEYIKMVQESAYLLLGLLNDILDISRVETGRMQLVPTLFDFHKVIEQIMSPLRARAEQKNLALTLETDQSIPPKLVGDHRRLRQILLNIVGNAIKFTHKGVIHFSIAAGERTDEQLTLQFTVSDTGVGIPSDKQEMIFEIFNQGDGSHSRQFGGAGIGLTISSQLIRMMNGKIRVQSETGEGSIFSFTLKLALPEAPAPLETQLFSDIGAPNLPEIN